MLRMPVATVIDEQIMRTRDTLGVTEGVSVFALDVTPQVRARQQANQLPRAATLASVLLTQYPDDAESTRLANEVIGENVNVLIPPQERVGRYGYKATATRSYYSRLIGRNAAWSNAMPPGNITEITPQERAVLAAWLADGAR